MVYKNHCFTGTNHKIKDMAKFDLIEFPEKIEILFILESPFKNEIKEGYPCAGATGKKMTAKIFPGNSNAFGKILKDKETGSERFGIFNTCHFPLDLPEKLSLEEKQVMKLKEDENQEDDREVIYSKMEGILAGIQNLEELTNYLKRLTQILNASSTIKNLVVCGFIAQSFFKFYFNIKEHPYNKSKELSINGKIFNVLFVNHPADRKRVWAFRLSALDNHIN